MRQKLSILSPFALRFEVNLVVVTLELDGVGPVDNRPSTDKLHHFVKKNKEITRDM